MANPVEDDALYRLLEGARARLRAEPERLQTSPWLAAFLDPLGPERPSLDWQRTGELCELIDPYGFFDKEGRGDFISWGADPALELVIASDFLLKAAWETRRLRFHDEPLAPQQTAALEALAGRLDRALRGDIP